jgi:predicted kinase
VATLHVLVGQSGAGKTTPAKRLDVEHDALRFTPDDWFVPLRPGDPDWTEWSSRRWPTLAE